MKTAIIVSKKDPAGMNIKECLSRYDLDSVNAFIVEVEKEPIYNEYIDKEVGADLFIFATKHQSAQGVHSLSCHSLGNFGKAEAGGSDGKLCIVPAVYLKEVFLLLNKYAGEISSGDNPTQPAPSDLQLKGDNTHPPAPSSSPLGYEVTMECTHHGPYLEKPCFFIEIGSREEQWKDKEAGEIIAKVIFKFLNKLKNDDFGDYHVVFSIGGTHYLASLNKFQLNSDIAIGHTCPKYQLENLDGNMVKQAIEKTKEKVDFVLLDWKGLGKEKHRIVELLKEMNIEFKRSDKV